MARAKKERFSFENALKDSDFLNKLSNKEYDINEKDDYGRTVLMYTVAKKRLNHITEQIIQLYDNIDKDAQDGNYNTAVIYAAKSGNCFSLKLLINNGFPVHTLAKYKTNALIEALKSRKEETALMLLESGADFRQKTIDGYNAVTLAAKHNFVAVMNKLIELKADLDSDNYYNEPAIFYAMKENNIEVLKLLLENGANLNYRAGASGTLHNITDWMKGLEQVELIEKYYDLLDEDLKVQFQEKRLKALMRKVS